jgi:hypothetical protein
MLLDVTVQSVMFVLLFAYVFGGSIEVPGGAATRSSCCRGSWRRPWSSRRVVAMGLTNDLQKGIVDRFKSLPISRSSVLVGAASPASSTPASASR